MTIRPSRRSTAPLIPIAILSLALLTGCLAEQKTQFARCADEGMRVHPRDLYERNPFIMACMDIAGYGRNLRDPQCNMNWLGETNPYCYAPKGPLARFLFRIENQFGADSS